MDGCWPNQARHKSLMDRLHMRSGQCLRSARPCAVTSPAKPCFRTRWRDDLATEVPPSPCGDDCWFMELPDSQHVPVATMTHCVIKQYEHCPIPTPSLE